MTVQSAVPIVSKLGNDGRLRVDLFALLRFAGPLVITNTIQAILNLTDTWFIGRLSTDALAAMGAIYWLMFCFIMILGGVGLAVQPFVSQADGSGRRNRASQSVWNGLWASLVSIPLFILASKAGQPILALFNLDPKVEALALEYWEPRLLGAVLGSMSWALMSFFNGIGAMRIALIVALITTLTNIAANQFFMFELDLGMQGSAWGTNLAQFFGLFAGFYFLLFGDIAKRYQVRLTWRPRLKMIWRQLAVGLPIGIMYGADVLGVALMQLMITQSGLVGAAATQIVIMLTSIAYMPALGLASAGITVVGQAIGAGNRDWAEQLGTFIIRSCSIFMFSIAVLILLFGPWVLPLFIGSDDANGVDVVATALLLLLPAATYQLFDGLYFGSSFCLRAAGDTTVPAVTALVLSWLVFVPLAHTLVFTPSQAWFPGLPQFGLGALGGWLSLMIYAILLGSFMYRRWHSGRWRTINIWGGCANN